VTETRPAAPVTGRAGLIARTKAWARGFARDLDALRLAAADPRVPWHAKALAVCVVAYALSPIDLIPDFVPVLGYLDDLVIVPLGIFLVLRLVPPAVMAEHRAAAAAREDAGATCSRWVAAAIVVGVWIAALVAAFVLATRGAA
jgi:uncharacterized membrane protein YkvA (DUF1232 family)